MAHPLPQCSLAPHIRVLPSTAACDDCKQSGVHVNTAGAHLFIMQKSTNVHVCIISQKPSTGKAWINVLHSSVNSHRAQKKTLMEQCAGNSRHAERFCLHDDYMTIMTMIHTEHKWQKKILMEQCAGNTQPAERFCFQSITFPSCLNFPLFCTIVANVCFYLFLFVCLFGNSQYAERFYFQSIAFPSCPNVPVL